MSRFTASLWIRLPTALLLGGAVQAQFSGYDNTIEATADSASTEAGGYLLSIPGVADDFVLFADGRFEERANGTARLSVYAHRASALDRDLFVVLEFAGRIGPGDAGYPPIGGPVVTLVPSAYVPLGAIDPTTFVYYATVTGTLTGLRAYAGVQLTASNVGPAQLGAGASNKNVLPGLRLDLALTVVAGSLQPTGPAELRLTFQPNLPMCASHIDSDPVTSGSTARHGVDLPGAGGDYVFASVGTWSERADGTATLTGRIRRQSDYSDAWQLQIALSQPLTPGNPAHPPAGSPVLQLLPFAYSGQAGPIDPGAYRYYQAAIGSLVGEQLNEGGVLQLSTLGIVQVGLGGGQGNTFFGVAGELAVSISQQPTTRFLTLTGPLRLQVNLAKSCILRPPQILSMSTTTLPSVTEQVLVLTGTDLGFSQLVAVGPHILGASPRNWYQGNLRIVDHTTAEVQIPQGLAPATYPIRLLNPANVSNVVMLAVQAPATITLRTEPDRLAGEPQHWATHQGNVVGFAFCFLLLSNSNQPSFAPGLVDLGIGNQFSDLVLVDVAVHDASTGVAVITIGAMPASLQGTRLYAQTALMDTTFFPLQPSDVRFTDY